MNLSLKLQVRQSQSLVMTPQLLQSIRLLQFGALELQAFIEREIEQNPLLELAVAGEPADPAEPPVPAADPEQELSGADTSLAAFEDAGHPEHEGEPASDRFADRIVSAPSVGDATVDDLADDRLSLFAHAIGEASEILTCPQDRKIGEILAMHLDEAGYMRTPPHELAEGLGVPVEQLCACLDRLRAQAEPAGLFARDLADCLALQLARIDRLDPVMAIVLANLDLLARRDFAALRRLTGEDQEDLIEILSEIRRLDPKPGIRFGLPKAEAVMPDVFVTRSGSGEWQVRLNPRALPRVLVDNHYAALVGRGATPADRDFMAQCQASAGWLVRSLDQRARTILKVASEIVRRQGDFLERGVPGLRPMTLAAVAEAVSLHESTISRVTANKYIQTPRGTFELKFFFTVAIAASDGGEAHSAESVKLRIKRMIEAESSDTVLSDDDIADRLKAEGVDLARRTVAKYREALGIASSIQRRRELKARCAGRQANPESTVAR